MLRFVRTAVENVFAAAQKRIDYMPTHRSAAKRMKQAEERRQNNVAVRTRLRTFLKRTREAIDNEDVAQIDDLLPQTVAYLDKAVTKGVIHWRSAARKKSHLMKRATEVRASAAKPSEQAEQ